MEAHLQQVLLLDVGAVEADVVADHQPLLPLPAVGTHRVEAGLQGDEVGQDQLAGPGVALLHQPLAAPRVPGSTRTPVLHPHTLIPPLHQRKPCVSVGSARPTPQEPAETVCV